METLAEICNYLGVTHHHSDVDDECDSHDDDGGDDRGCLWEPQAISKLLKL